MKSLSSLSETEVQNSILEFLYFKKIDAWRQNNHGIYDHKREAYRRKNKWEKHLGSPLDIAGILPDGTHLEIEVKKNEREKCTGGQLERIKVVTRNNGVAFKAFSLKCVKENLKDYLT